MTTAKRKRVTPETTAALVALTEQGLSRSDAGKALGLSSDQVKRALDETKLELQARASEYARLHLEASRVAAEKGKAEPMQWALERIGVVQPPTPQPQQQGGGTVIKIGIALPGLSGRAVTAVQQLPEATDAELEITEPE